MAAIGLELDPPVEIDVEPLEDGDTVVRCSERDGDKTVGELEVAVFKAALVIDRDGILEEKAHLAADAQSGRATPPVPVSLPGASGFRADVVLVRPGVAAPALPYVHVFAIAPLDLGVDGGVIVTVRSAAPEWPAADAILRTMRVLGRGAKANDGGTGNHSPLFPIVGVREGDDDDDGDP